MGLDFTVVATLLSFEDEEHLKHPDVRVVRCDVTSEEQTLDLKTHVQNIGSGSLDVLVNNAGICTLMVSPKMVVPNVLHRLYDDGRRHRCTSS